LRDPRALWHTLVAGRRQITVPGTHPRDDLARKREIKQLRQACRELGLSAVERYEASKALHAEKESAGERKHMSYRELLAWLREWKER
jgi:hypothetical protein